MSEKFIENLFHFPGVKNPENIEQVIRKAFLNVHELEKAGYEFNGASATYTRKKGWMKIPKISVTGTNGRVSISLSRNTTPTASKFMIAVLYCIAYLRNKTKSAELFYNDQHGKNRSIASRHGPEHSEYMQRLISKLNDENFMLELDALIENPLPENWTIPSSDDDETDNEQESSTEKSDGNLIVVFAEDFVQQFVAANRSRVELVEMDGLIPYLTRKGITHDEMVAHLGSKKMKHEREMIASIVKPISIIREQRDTFGELTYYEIQSEIILINQLDFDLSDRELLRRAAAAA